jgi:hypothetical protein
LISISSNSGAGQVTRGWKQSKQLGRVKRVEWTGQDLYTLHSDCVCDIVTADIEVTDCRAKYDVKTVQEVKS